MWMFSDKLQYYANVETLTDYSHQLNDDFQNLSKQYNESVQLALKINQNLKVKEIDNIMISESKTLEQVTQSKNLLLAQMTNPGNVQIASSFKMIMLSCIQAVQQNIANTKKIQHDLLLQEMNITLQ
jgi:hypothetical protein